MENHKTSKTKKRRRHACIRCHSIRNHVPPKSLRFAPDESRRAQSLFQISQEVRKKQIARQPSFAESIWNLLRFQTWHHWVLLGAIFPAAVLLILFSGHFRGSGGTPPAACSVFAALAGNICISSVARLFSHNMAELEKTFYLDLKLMVCIQMLEGAVTDLPALALLAAFFGNRCENGFLAFLLYLLVPFLWSNAFYLHMLIHLRSIFSGFWQTACGLLCGLLALFPAAWKQAYAAGAVPVWALLSAGGFVMLAFEIYHMFRNIENGEKICLN